MSRAPNGSGRRPGKLERDSAARTLRSPEAHTNRTKGFAQNPPENTKESKTKPQKLTLQAGAERNLELFKAMLPEIDSWRKAFRLQDAYSSCFLQNTTYFFVFFPVGVVEVLVFRFVGVVLLKLVFVLMLSCLCFGVLLLVNNMLDCCECVSLFAWWPGVFSVSMVVCFSFRRNWSFVCLWPFASLVVCKYPHVTFFFGRSSCSFSRSAVFKNETVLVDSTFSR